MNEFSTLLLDQPTVTQTTFAQTAFSQNGRKGVSYDWQSLLAEAATLRELDLELELATACSE